MSGTIVLDNGTTSITLGAVGESYIIGYDQDKITDIPSKDIPGKSTVTLDKDSYVTRPKIYTIQIECINSTKSTLKDIEDDREYITLTDDEGANSNLWMSSLRFKYKPGYTNLPWVGTIILKG